LTHKKSNHGILLTATGESPKLVPSALAVLHDSPHADCWGVVARPWWIFWSQTLPPKPSFLYNPYKKLDFVKKASILIEPVQSFVKQLTLEDFIRKVK
jgi:hypothetical protein